MGRVHVLVCSPSTSFNTRKCGFTLWLISHVTSVLLFWLFLCAYVYDFVSSECIRVCVRPPGLSHHPSPLIRLDRCYYIEMRAVMYASLMWTCPLLLDGTWRLSLSWRVCEKNNVPTLCLKYGPWDTMKRPKHISLRRCRKVTRHISKFPKSAYKSDVRSI